MADVVLCSPWERSVYTVRSSAYLITDSYMAKQAVSKHALAVQ